MKTTSTLLVAAVAALALAPSVAAAQRPTRRQAAIEIRGTVPTPQVTTVRPREVPAYNRQVLVPDFYDHNFWQSILPAYQLVQSRVITGAAPAAPTVPGATAPGATPPAGTTPPATTPPGAAPAAGTPPATTPPAGAPPARPASTTPGTAPATPPR